MSSGMIRHRNSEPHNLEAAALHLINEQDLKIVAHTRMSEVRNAKI
jgi:hypothetical protein